MTPAQRKALIEFLLMIHYANILQMTAAPHFWHGIRKTE